MKNRKTIIVGFILVACMIMGVGYAALSDTFTIDGNATVSAENANDYFNEHVYFQGVVLPNSTVVSDVVDRNTYGYTASINTAQDSASYHIYNLEGQNNETTITFRITNDGDLDAKITLIETQSNSNDTYFDVTYEVDGSTLAAGVEIDKNSSIDLVVTVRMKNTPQSGITGEFDLGFRVESVEP